MSERTWRTNARPTHQGPDGFNHVPAVATRSVLARVTGLFFLLGGTAILYRSPDLLVSSRDRAIIVTIGASWMVLGAALIAVGKQLPRWTYHGFVGIGTATITAIITLSHGTPSAETYALLYILIIIVAAFFFSWSEMLVHTMAVQLATAYALSYVGASRSMIGLYLGIYLSVSFTVAWLVRVADRAEEDPLTGLTNRRGLARNLEVCAEEAARTGEPLSVIIIDLDHFKQINDVRGHAVGDELLLACAKHWRELAPNPRLLCRYGGDEFALLLPGYTLGRAAELADQMRVGLPFDHTASVGVAAWEHGDSGSALMSRADIALYDAKTNGRDQTVVYGDPERAARELEHAIAAQQLVVYYQPVISLDDGRTVNEEALVRWQHPAQGLVDPHSFLPHAERTGAIHALGAWTLDQVCRELATRASEAASGPSIAINVATPELRNATYTALVDDALRRHGVPASRLVIEVREAALGHPDRQVAATLHELRALGVQVAVDDFGAGASSLRWLTHFSLDILKIDGEFIDQITEDTEQAPVVEALVALAQALDVTVVASHVETAHQAALLQAMGCEWAQGYHFGRPAPRTSLSVDGQDQTMPPRDGATLRA